MSRVLARLRADERGFGMVELVAALSIMSIGILALVAAFNSGALALQRSARVSTATVLAERQLELYRGMTWEQIGLAADSADPLYAANRPYGQATQLSCDPASALPECAAIQTLNGPDGRSYRVDTYVVQHDFADQGGSALRPVKVVRVLVRDGSDLSSVLVRQESTFDGELPPAEDA
jgi:prepilin-type N-terminal cleavage/methylation domain-containing protein